MTHHCTSILIHCMDFRLEKEIHRFLEERNMGGDCDIVSLAGAAKDLVDGGEGARQMIMKQIKTSHELHEAGRVVLMHHTECGAYGQQYDFRSEEEEIEQHKIDLAKAAEYIRTQIPGIKVDKIIARMLDHDGQRLEFIELA